MTEKGQTQRLDARPFLSSHWPIHGGRDCCREAERRWFASLRRYAFVDAEEILMEVQLLQCDTAVLLKDATRASD